MTISLVFLAITMAILEIVSISLFTTFLDVIFTEESSQKSLTRFVASYVDFSDANQEKIFFAILFFVFISITTIARTLLIRKRFNSAVEIITTISKACMTSSINKPYAKIITINTNEQINILSKDIEQLSKSIGAALSITSFVLLIFGISAFLIITEPLVSIIFIFLLTGASIISTILTNKRIKNLSLRRRTLYSEILASIKESFSGIRDIKMNSREKSAIKEYTTLVYQYKSNDALMNFLKAIQKNSIEYSLTIAITLVILLPIMLDIDGTQILIKLSAIIFGVSRIASPLTIVSQSITDISSNSATLQVLNDILFETNQSLKRKKRVVGKKLEKIEPIKDICFKNISFKYENTNTEIKNVNIKLTSGDYLGIVGKSGSGKSTLLDILMGLLPPASGDIYINKKSNISTKVSSENLKRFFTYVPQSAFFADDTIEKNVTLSDDIATDKERLYQALDLALLSEFNSEDIHKRIGENARFLSGGQKQRLSIARAIYNNDKPILILDEATSSLDNRTESEIMKNLTNLFSDKIIISVAHRINTLEKCTKLILLDGGVIVKSGSFESVTSDPIFKKLVSRNNT